MVADGPVDPNDPEICISGIRERDIDLFLIEEFVASPSFLNWFLARVELNGPADLVGVTLSEQVTTGESPMAKGESDVVLKIRQGKSTIGLHIENKIDAVLQDRQAERYSDRAIHCRDRGDYDHALTILVAPAAYSADGFDRRVSYEETSDWLKQQPRSPRVLYKLALLKAALDRNKETQRWRDNEESFFNKVKNSSPTNLEALNQLYRWTKQQADYMKFGAGCFLPQLSVLSKRPVFEAHCDGTIRLNFTWLDPKYEPKNQWSLEETWRRAFREDLRHAGFPIPEDCIENFPLHPSQWIPKLPEFIRIVEHQIERSRSGSRLTLTK